MSREFVKFPRRLAGACLLVGMLVGSAAFAQTRDVLRVGLGDMPTMLDPQAYASITGLRFYTNVFDALMKLDPFTSEIEPALATDWQRLSDTTLELHLRQGVLFHDGTPFTAADVKFSIDRVIGGGSLFANARAMLSVIDHVEIVDDLTVRVVTAAPDPVLELRLANLWGDWIVPKAYVEEHGDEYFQRNPIGTGPFMVTLFEPDRVELTAFDGYWGEKPNVRKVEYRGIPEATARLTALVNDEVDIMSPVVSDQIEALSTYSNVTVQCHPQNLVHLLTYNTANPLMADPLLRQGINLAIDRDLIIETLWAGRASATRGFQFEDFGDMYLEDVPYTEYDPERARELIEASDYAGDTLYYDLVPGYYENDLQAAEAIVEMLAEVGVKVQIRATTKFWQNPDRAIHPWSYAERFPDPVAGLWLLFGADSSRQAKGQNDWIDASEEFNATGYALAGTVDQATRNALWADLHAMWLTEAPGTTLWRSAICTGVNNQVNWNIYPTQTMDFGAANLSFKD